MSRAAERRAEYIAVMRQILDLMEAHPGIPVPPAPSLGYYLDGDHAASVVAVFESVNLDNRTVEIKPEDADYGFVLRGNLGPIQIRVLAPLSAVCTATGQTMVTNYEYSPAPAELTPVEQADGHPDPLPPVAGPGEPETAGTR